MSTVVQDSPGMAGKPLLNWTTVAVCGGLLFLVSLLQTGYRVYFANHTFQIPLIHLLNQPSLYPNDPFAATLPYYASMLWHWLAWVSRYLPLEPMFLGLFLLSRVLLLGAAGYLAWKFVPSRLGVILAIAIFALPIQPIVAHGTIVTSYFEQTGLSIPFFLLSLAAFYAGCPILCGVLLAIGFNLNSMYGVYTITYLAASLLVDPTARATWKRWLWGLGMFLLLVFPAFLLTLTAFERGTSNPQLWLLANQMQYPFHFYPHLWTKAEFFRLGLLAVLTLGGLFQAHRPPARLFRLGAAWTLVALAWLVYAFIAAYVIKSPAMLVMHPGRATDLWYCFVTIALTATCARQLEVGGLGERIPALLLLGATFLIWSPIGGLLLLSGLLLSVLRPVQQYCLSRRFARDLAVVCTSVLLLLGTGTLHQRLQAESSNTNPAGSTQNSVEMVSQWAIAHTPIEAQFLVDPKWLSEWALFRSLAQRPVFVTWQDGLAMLWDRGYVSIWLERFKALGLDFTQPGLTREQAVIQSSEVYRNLTDAKVQQLKTQFPLDYWVVPLEHASSLPVVFQTPVHKVLSLQSP